MTLAVAIVGAVTGCLALLIQAASFFREGPRVKISAGHALVTHVGEWFITVTAINHGRSPITVTSWGLRLPDKGGQIVSTHRLPFGDHAPHRLDGSDSATFFIDQGDVLRDCASRGLKAKQLKPFVHLSDGSTVVGKDGIPWED